MRFPACFVVVLFWYLFVFCLRVLLLFVLDFLCVPDFGLQFWFATCWFSFVTDGLY